MTDEVFATYAIYSILMIMFLKEAGVPLPIPSDLVMIAAGAQAAVGSFSLVELAIAVEAALIVGGSAQFLVARGPGRRFLYRFGRNFGMTSERLDKASSIFRRRGATAVFISLNVPGARAGTIVAAGLAGLSYRSFAPAMIAGSTIFYAWHIGLGYAAGPSAANLVESINGRLAIGIVGLGVLGFVGLLFLRLRRRRAGADVPQATESVYSWSHAACPACVASAAVRRLANRNAVLEPEGTGAP